MSLHLLFLLAIVIAAITLYVWFINLKMMQTAIVTGKADVVAAKTGFAKFWAILQGWKTHILAAIVGGVQLVASIPHILAYLDEDLLKQWQALPWATVVDAKVANLITFACALIIPVTHAAGLAKAAATAPATPTQTPGS
jgi:hypothetical protein